MKKQLACALLAAASGLAYGDTTYEEALVLESHPVYRTVHVTVPRRECWQEEVVRTHRPDRYRSHTPGLLGAVVGGALGNAVGHNKSNKRVGAVVGAIVGGSVARDLSHRGRERENVVYHDLVERCETVHERREEQKLVGYDVLYGYNGREYSIRLPQDPGPTLRLRVKVEPVL